MLCMHSIDTVLLKENATAKTESTDFRNRRDQPWSFGKGDSAVHNPMGPTQTRRCELGYEVSSRDRKAKDAMAV